LWSSLPATMNPNFHRALKRRGAKRERWPMDWVLTWARTAFISISRKNIPPPLEHAAFDNQTEAVNFAMSLDYPQRRTVRLHLPGGDIAELAVIEQMYAQHQREK
jgi:hypothetical protein